MTATVSATPALDVERLREDFPILAEQRARQAAGLPRQRRHQPEAPAVIDAVSRFYGARTPTSTAACTT